MKKVAILAIKAGGGHMAAMHSLKRALVKHQKDIKVETVISKDSSIEKAHIFLNTKIPLLYSFGYFLSDYNFFGLIRILKSILPIKDPYWRDFKHLFNDPKIEVIMSTHYLITEQLLRMKRKFKSSKKIVAYVPDFDLSRVHFPSVFGTVPDAVISQSPYFLAKLHRNFGIPYENLVEAGFLSSKEFQNGVENSESSNKIELNDYKLKILIAGGSIWTERIAKKIQSLTKKEKELWKKVQFIVITGGFSKGIRKYKQISKNTNLDFLILDHLNQEDLANVYKHSDLAILASLAPATLYELIETETRPIIVTRINKGQEKYNLEYALSRKLIEWKPKTIDLYQYLKSFIEDAEFQSTKKSFFESSHRNELNEARENSKNVANFIRRLI